MIERAVLARIDRPSAQGRTGPLLAACETECGQEVEVFLKLSAGCDQGVVNLAREAVAACLAADLGLPIPRPWLIEIPPEIVRAVADPAVAAKLKDSAPVAFGSTRAPGFAVWTSGMRLSDSMRSIAVAILLFDAIIQNPDRRAENPNCLFRGDELRIIDHELAFAHRLILLWRPPWAVGGMQDLETPGRHIFVHVLKGEALDFADARRRWATLSDGQLAEYAQAMPPEWRSAQADVDAALQLIKDARVNIDACITELGRVLA